MAEIAKDRRAVLVADDDSSSARALAEALRRAGYEAAVTSGARLKRSLAERDFDVVISGAEGDDADWMQARAGVDAPHAVIRLAGFGSIHDAVEAMRAGAFDYLSKPASEDQILISVARAIEQRALRAENQRLRAHLSQRFELSNMLSRDPSFQRVFQTVDALADTRAARSPAP